MPETLVLLHGFGGTRRAWDGVCDQIERERYRPLALDLPGHGRMAGCGRPITFDACVQHVLAAAPERFVLCGYSLGGRVALHVALAAPERVLALALVSCSPGIEDPGERAARLARDDALADELESASFEAWIERWRSQPVFAGEPEPVRRRAGEDQRRNDPLALAAALRGLSVGAMAPLWGRLPELSMPTSVIVGERDAKFRALGERTAREVPGSAYVVISGGHGLPLESPAELARALERLHP
ncbi:MAG TPA: alpha/beta fold hydrolase [Solirubrobacteraceae bacterium]|nr:alpha/beta fold hydrolase [Solirubrobacteraceae bacterium]